MLAALDLDMPEMFQTSVSKFTSREVAPLWHDSMSIDPNSFHSLKLKELAKLPKRNHERNNMLEKYVTENIRTNAHEKEINGII